MSQTDTIVITAAHERLRKIEVEIGKKPIDVQHRIKTMAATLREYINTHGDEGYAAIALVGARLAAEKL